MAQAADHDRPGRGVERAQRRYPVVHAGVVAAGGRIGVEDVTRELTRGPLVLEDRGELAGSAGRVEPANPMAMNAGSQRHWCGYRSDAALFQPPFSLRRNTRASSSNNPKEGTLPPLAAAQGQLIPGSREKRDLSVLRGRKSSDPCPYRVDESCTDWPERTKG